MYIYSFLRAECLMTQIWISKEDHSKGDENTTKNCHQSGIYINANGKSLQRKHKDSEHSKCDRTNKTLKGTSLNKKHKDNKNGRLDGTSMNPEGDSLEIKHEENEQRKVQAEETHVNIMGEVSQRKRKHGKHGKGTKKAKKSKKEQVNPGSLISSSNHGIYSGQDIPDEGKRKSSDLFNSQGAKSASSLINEPDMQDFSSASLFANDLLTTVKYKMCLEGKRFCDVHPNSHTFSLNDMKQESDVLTYQKSRDHEYSSENPEEKLFFTILHKYATTDGRDEAKTKQELKDNNVFHLVQHGKWRQSEVMQLKVNMDYFKATFPACDPSIFLYSYKYPSQRKGQERLEYRNLRCSFLRCLGYKIKRHLTNVYIKAVLYFFQGKTGKFSASEVELIRKHGDMKSSHRFAKLASKLDRHYFNIRWIYKDLGDEQTQTGPWTSKEDKILLKAVKTAQVQFGGDSLMGLPWTEISKTVRTRPPGTCRIRYVRTLRWREVHQSTFKPPVSTADKIRLIEMICESNVQEEVEIDWHLLLKDFPEISSHISLQQVWHMLKIKVPDYSCKNLDEITDYLAKFEIPKLQRKLEKQLQRVEDERKVLKMEDTDV